MGVTAAHALRERLTLQQRTEVADGYGGQTVTWTTYGKASGRLVPRPIRMEALASGQVRANEYAEAILDVQELTPTGAMRLVSQDGRTWKIIGLSPPHGNIQQLQLELHKP